MMKNILIIITFLVSGLGFAQVNQVSGNVLDGEFNNEPLAFVKVTIKNTDQNIETDLKGKYSIILKPGIYTFVYEFVGYEVVEVKNTVIDREKIILNNVVLTAKNLPLTNSIVSKE